MNRILFPLIALILAGCQSYTEVATNINGRLVDNNAEAIGDVLVLNISYNWFGCLPWCTGTTWQKGPYEEEGVVSKVTWFEDKATLDEQLRGVKHAMDEFGATRVTNLRTKINEDSLWSLFLMTRRVVKTHATLLK